MFCIKQKKNENLPCIWMRNYKRVIHLKKINILCGEICCLDIQRILEKKNEILKIYEIILIIWNWRTSNSIKKIRIWKSWCCLFYHFFFSIIHSISSLMSPLLSFSLPPSFLGSLPSFFLALSFFSAISLFSTIIHVKSGANVYIFELLNIIWYYFFNYKMFKNWVMFIFIKFHIKISIFKIYYL